MTDSAPQPPRWSPNAVLARLAFGSGTRDLHDNAGPDGEAELELDLDDPVQRTLGEFELLELVGQGGMGVVYRAHQRQLQRDVALKLLSAGAWASDEFVARFQSEAQHAARLQHPNIVTVYEIGEHRGLIYYAMEFVPGISLDQRLHRDGPMAPHAAATLLLSIAEAVDYAHRLGVLHLDLKPGNVLIAADGTAKIADFGLARKLDNEGGIVNDRVFGTPGYLAPEQTEVGTATLDRSTDVWGIGAIAYEVLTGRPPFDADHSRVALDDVRHRPVRPPGELQPGLPDDLDAICLHCLEKRQHDRYPSARALADDLRRFLEGRPVSVRPLGTWQRGVRWMRREPRLAIAGALAVVALVAGIVATSVQWMRAEQSATDARRQTWSTRADAAWRMVQEGRNFAASRLVLDNLREREAAGDRDGAILERLRLGTLQRGGAQLIDAIATGATGWTVALDRRGTRAAAVVETSEVRLYNVHDGRERWRVQTRDASHYWRDPVNRIAFTPDGRFLIVDRGEPNIVVHPAGHDNILIDAANGSIVLPPPQRFADFRDATYSLDGRYAILRNRQEQAQLFRVEDWQPLTPKRDFGAINGMWRIGDNARYVAYTHMQDLELLDTRTFRTRHVVNFPKDQKIDSWAEQPGGPLLALGHLDGTVHLLDTQSLRMRALSPSPYQSVRWLAFSDDGRWLAAATADRSFVWDVASGHGGPLPAGRGSAATQVQLDTRTGTVFAFNPPDGVLWSLPAAGSMAERVAGARMRVPQLPMGSGLDPYSATMAPDAGLIASIDWGGEVRLWRWRNDDVLGARASPQYLADLHFDGRHVPVLADGGVRVVDVSDERPASPLMAHPQPVSLASLTPDGSALVTVCGREVRVFDWRSGRLRFAPIVMDDSPLRVSVSPDSGVLLLSTGGYRNGTFHELVSSFDLRTGAAHAARVPLPGPLTGMRFAPDGRRFVFWRYGEVGVRDATTLARVGTDRRFGPDDMAATFRRLYGERGSLRDETRKGTPVMDAALAADGTTVDVLVRPSSRLNGRYTRLDIVSGRTLRNRELSTAEALRLLPRDDEYEFVASEPSGARWLDTLGRNLPLPMASGDLLMAQAVSRDGRWFASSATGGVVLADRDNGQWASAPLPAALPSGDVIAQLAFSPDATTLLARSHHGRWLWWPLPRASQSPDAIARRLDRLRPPSIANTRLVAPPWPTQERAEFRRHDPGVPPMRTVETDAPMPTLASSPRPGLAFVDLQRAINYPVDSTGMVFDDPLGYLATVPLGVQQYLGTPFDIRGVVAMSMTSGPGLPQVGPHSSPVPAPVPHFTTLHVLLTGCCLLQGRPRAPYAQVVIGYADGSTARVPILYHQHLWEPWGDPGDAIPARVAWVEPPPRAMVNFESPYRIYSARLANPHPQRAVSTLAFEATDKPWSGPLILAVTVETTPPQAIARR